jgi:hypothetical protein
MSQESDQNEALWAKSKGPITLPVITQIRIGLIDRSVPVDPTVEPTLMAQMDSLGGKHFLLPLTVKAARGLIFSLARQLELAGFELNEQRSDKPRTTH